MTDQPICARCFAARFPARTAHPLTERHEETCCDCGEMTASGIYFRVDPRSVAYPTDEE
ncbi:MAG: hypothetical protein ACM3SS_06910 [Rhodospirillaceae bacterium]